MTLCLFVLMLLLCSLPCSEGNVDMSKIAEQAEADAQWIISNTKPCPSCSSPIQKTEGCNHMTCRKVHYLNIGLIIVQLLIIFILF